MFIQKSSPLFKKNADLVFIFFKEFWEYVGNWIFIWDMANDIVTIISIAVFFWY